MPKAPVWLESLGRLFAKRTPRPKAAGPDANLSSALRVYVLEALSAECGEFDTNDRSSNTP